MYEKKITDKDLQYGIGNYIQYFVISYKRKEMKKYIYSAIYIQ